MQGFGESHSGLLCGEHVAVHDQVGADVCEPHPSRLVGHTLAGATQTCGKS